MPCKINKLKIQKNSPECIEQNFEALRMLGEFEQPQNANNREKFQIWSGTKPGGQAEINVEG